MEVLLNPKPLICAVPACLLVSGKHGDGQLPLGYSYHYHSDSWLT